MTALNYLEAGICKRIPSPGGINRPVITGKHSTTHKHKQAKTYADLRRRPVQYVVNVAHCLSLNIKRVVYKDRVQKILQPLFVHCGILRIHKTHHQIIIAITDKNR